jgi:hypothetical protein
MWAKQEPSLADFLHMVSIGGGRDDVITSQLEACEALYDSLVGASGEPDPYPLEGGIFKVEVENCDDIEEMARYKLGIFPPFIREAVAQFKQYPLLVKVSANANILSKRFDLESRWMRADDLASWWKDQVLPWADKRTSQYESPQLVAIRIFILGQGHTKNRKWVSTEVCRMLHRFYPQEGDA